MDEAQVGAALREHLTALAELPLELQVVKDTERVELGAVASFDTELIAKEVLAVRGRLPFIQRFHHDWLDEEVPREFALHHAIDEDAVKQYVKDLAKRANRKPKNAQRKLVEAKYAMAIKPDVDGIEIQTDKTFEQMISLATVAAKTGHTSSLLVPYERVQAKITEKKLQKKTALVVSLTRRRIYLYKGDKLVKSYPCAIGTPAHPTPRGDFFIEAKRYMPTWTNPGSAWAKDMPQSIPPGASNPLGLRAINLSISGIRIHGTTNIGSIGSAASHGCMRVPNSLIVDLFPRVEVGDPVYIRF
jgi:lipoprotein-anchoring transpeptidase ErfK/SrfK